MIAKRSMWAGALVLTVSLFTAASTFGSEASPEFRFIKAGPVSEIGDEFTLVGRFMVTPDNAGDGLQDRSHGSGGACIVGDLAKMGAPETVCTSSAVCNEAWATYHQANSGNPNFDAAAFGNNGNGNCVKGRCWYRPGTGTNLCQRGLAVRDIGVYEIKPPRLQHVANFYGADSKIDWQVVACANRAQPNGTDAPSCSQSVGIYDPGMEVPSHPESEGWDAHIRTLPSTSD